MQEECSQHLFERTIVNIRPYMASRAPPPPHHGMLSSSPLAPGTLVLSAGPATPTPLLISHASKTPRKPTSNLPTSAPQLNLTICHFRLVWIDPCDNKTVLKDNHSPHSQSPTHQRRNPRRRSPRPPRRNPPCSHKHRLSHFRVLPHSAPPPRPTVHLLTPPTRTAIPTVPPTAYPTSTQPTATSCG
jgi:hypothetical protein